MSRHGAAAPRPFRFGVQAVTAPSLAAWTALAREAEDLGYDVLTMAEHFEGHLAPGPALATAAAVTSELRIGTLVYANDYRHPVMLAREVATLDLLSAGRFEFGIGAGWMVSEYEAAGMTMDPPRVRIDRMREAISVCRAVLGGGDHDGSHYTVRGLREVVRPAQAPLPPLLVGGGGRRVLSLAAREADIVGVNVDLRSGRFGADARADATPSRTDQKLAWVREAAGERFDDLELQARVHATHVTDAPGAARHAGRGMDPDELRGSPHALVGTVTAICDQLEHLRARWGISYLTISSAAMRSFGPVVARMRGR